MLPQVAADQDLADLLSTLRDHSTAGPGGLYAAALPPQPPLLPNDGGAGPAEGEAAAEGQATGEGGAGKVAAVCATVRAALQQKDEVRRCPIYPPPPSPPPRSKHAHTYLHYCRQSPPRRPATCAPSSPATRSVGSWRRRWPWCSGAGSGSCRRVPCCTCLVRGDPTAGGERGAASVCVYVCTCV
jgi:hypothetical protein